MTNEALRLVRARTTDYMTVAAECSYGWDWTSRTHESIVRQLAGTDRVQVSRRMPVSARKWLKEQGVL